MLLLKLWGSASVNIPLPIQVYKGGYIMKAKFSKSLLSLILAIVMVVSMVTVGIITASSAKIYVAGTGAVMEV